MPQNPANKDTKKEKKSTVEGKAKQKQYDPLNEVPRQNRSNSPVGFLECFTLLPHVLF